MDKEISQIVNIMEMADPSFVNVDPSVPTQLEIDIIPSGNSNDSGSGSFHANDYLIAKQLLTQVGNFERVRELFANLEQVMDTLNLKDDPVETIAQCCDDIY